VATGACSTPYKKSKCLATKNVLEKTFENHSILDNHVRLADTIARCPRQVILSYNDHPKIRELYADYWMHETSWTHSVSSARTAGKELIITNFPIEFAENDTGLIEELAA
jgi:site-specific DNA-adenine methylase